MAGWWFGFQCPLCHLIFLHQSNVRIHHVFHQSLEIHLRKGTSGNDCDFWTTVCKPRFNFFCTKNYQLPFLSPLPLIVKTMSSISTHPWCPSQLGLCLGRISQQLLNLTQMNIWDFCNTAQRILFVLGLLSALVFGLYRIFGKAFVANLCWSVELWVHSESHLKKNTT